MTSLDPEEVARRRDNARERADAAAERQRHAEERAEIADREAEEAPDEASAARHRDEAGRHRRAAQMHATAVEDQQEAAALLDIHREVDERAVEAGSVIAIGDEMDTVLELEAEHSATIERHAGEERAAIDALKDEVAPDG